MAELTVDLFVSLDGFAAGVDVGPYFGLGGPELDRWVASVGSVPQTIVMGRVTYEALAELSATATDPVSARLTATPKIVLSNSLEEPLAWPNTRLVRGDAVRELGVLKRASSVPLRTLGSLSLVRSLMESGLVDRFRVMLFPILLGGAGHERILEGIGRTRFQLVAHQTLDGRLMLLEYQPARAGDGSSA
jgi:dihydrofolate reductase